MSEKTLNSILGTMSAVQARQISELLQKLQVAGRVRNAEEYSSKIQELSALVNSSSPAPSLTQIKALAWFLCNSEAHNIMMESIKKDIESSFLQVDDISRKVNDHSVLFMENLIQDLESGLKKQEKLLSRLEWLSNSNNEFSSVLIDNFSSFAQTPRTKDSDYLYYDNRSLRTVSIEELPSAVISFQNNKLILPSEKDSIVRPTSVVFQSDNYSYPSKINYDYDNKLENLIDGQKNTYWENNVFLDEKVEKVTTVLEFRLGFAKSVNYIVIEGASSAEFLIESLVGISVEGHRMNLITEEVTVNGKTRIDFEKQNLFSVLITFSSSNYKKIEKNVSVDSLSFSANTTSDKIEQRNAISSIVKKALTTFELSQICNVPTFSDKQLNFYSYSFGLDNVWLGNSLYSNSGIFVSKPLSLTNPSLVSVNLKDEVETGVVKNTIECEIIKVDISPKYKETRFSIPKLNQRTIESERLVLQKKSTSSIINDVGSLRFFPYISSSFSPTVYKNGEALDIELGDWEYSISESTSGENLSLIWKKSFNDFSIDDYNSISAPLVFFIKINNPDFGSIYTVNYKIQESNSEVSKTIWLDEDRSVFLGEKGKVYFIRKDPDSFIESELYLQLTLRRNKPAESSSPGINEYALLGAEY